MTEVAEDTFAATGAGTEYVGLTGVAEEPFEAAGAVKTQSDNKGEGSDTDTMCKDSSASGTGAGEGVTNSLSILLST